MLPDERIHWLRLRANAQEFVQIWTDHGKAKKAMQEASDLSTKLLTMTPKPTMVAVVINGAVQAVRMIDDLLREAE